MIVHHVSSASPYAPSCATTAIAPSCTRDTTAAVRLAQGDGPSRLHQQPHRIMNVQALPARA
eukprot:5928873-Prymnesium_polylepis.1